MDRMYMGERITGGHRSTRSSILTSSGNTDLDLYGTRSLCHAFGKYHPKIQLPPWLLNEASLEQSPTTEQVFEMFHINSKDTDFYWSLKGDRYTVSVETTSTSSNQSNLGPFFDHDLKSYWNCYPQHELKDSIVDADLDKLGKKLSTIINISPDLVTSNTLFCKHGYVVHLIARAVFSRVEDIINRAPGVKFVRFDCSRQGWNVWTEGPVPLILLGHRTITAKQHKTEQFLLYSNEFQLDSSFDFSKLAKAAYKWPTDNASEYPSITKIYQLLVKCEGWNILPQLLSHIIKPISNQKFIVELLSHPEKYSTFFEDLATWIPTLVIDLETQTLIKFSDEPGSLCDDLREQFMGAVCLKDTRRLRIQTSIFGYLFGISNSPFNFGRKFGFNENDLLVQCIDITEEIIKVFNQEGDEEGLQSHLDEIQLELKKLIKNDPLDFLLKSIHPLAFEAKFEGQVYGPLILRREPRTIKSNYRYYFPYRHNDRYCLYSSLDDTGDTCSLEIGLGDNRQIRVIYDCSPYSQDHLRPVYVKDANGKALPALLQG